MMWSSSNGAPHRHADADDTSDDESSPPDFELDSRGVVVGSGAHLTRAEAEAIAAAEEARRPRRPFASGLYGGSSSSSEGHGRTAASRATLELPPGASPYVFGYGGQTPMNTPAPGTGSSNGGGSTPKPASASGTGAGSCRRYGTACILLVLLAETLLVLFALSGRSGMATGTSGGGGATCAPTIVTPGGGMAAAGAGGGAAPMYLSSMPRAAQPQQPQQPLQSAPLSIAPDVPLASGGDGGAPLTPSVSELDPIVAQMLAARFDPTAAEQRVEAANNLIGAHLAELMASAAAPTPVAIPSGVSGLPAPPAARPPATAASAAGAAAPAAAAATTGVVTSASGQRVPASMPVLADKLGSVQPSRALGPLLVTGSHRSGSSWLGSTLIAAHASLCYVDEPFHVTHRAPASPFQRWFFYIPEWMRRTPSLFPTTTHTPPAEVDRLVRANLVALPTGAAAPVWPATKQAMAAAAAKSGLAVPKGEDPALYYHPLLNMDEVNAYLDVSMRCQLKAAPRQYPLYIRLVKQRVRKTSATVPLMKDPIALFSTPYLAKTYGVRPILLVRHPAAFVDSLVRPHWGFDWKDFTSQPWLMEDLLAPYADEIRAAERGEYPNRYTEPFPSPQQSEFEGWIKFAGHGLEPNPKAKPAAQPYRGKSAREIVDALAQDTTINAFTSPGGLVRTDPGPRGEWARFKSQSESTLYVRASKQQDLIETGILLWRIFYGVTARFQLEHPDWMVVRYEDLVRDRMTHFAKLFDYAGMPFDTASRKRLAEMKFPRGIDHFRQTLTWQEIAHIKHRTRDVWQQFYTEDDWFGSDQPGAQRMEFVKK